MHPSTIALVDLSHLIMTRWGSDQHTCVATVRDWLRTIDTAYKGRLLIAVDSPPYSRSTVFPEYKAKRAEKEPELLTAIADIKAMAERMYPGQVFAHKGAEADDIIATLVARIAEVDVAAGLELTPVDIISSDKDLFHLVGDGVTVESPRTGARLSTREQVKEKMGVFPEQVTDFLALAGDSSDGLPGAKGLGPKKAIPLLEQYGTLKAIMAAVDANDKLMDPKCLALIKEHRAMVATCYMLAKQETDLPLTFDPKAFEASRERETVFEDLAAPPPSVENEPEEREKRKFHGLNIFQRMREVMKDVPGIKKGTEHAQQGYRYTGHEAVTWHLRPAYIRHGIVRTCSVKSTEIAGSTLSVVLTVRWTNVDEPTDFFEVDSVGIAPAPTKDAAKMVATQSGVAMSYAQKNAEFKAFCITGDDTPDAEEFS
jgi:5'-3' exonuclease